MKTSNSLFCDGSKSSGSLHYCKLEENSSQPDWSYLPQVIWNDIVSLLFNKILPASQALKTHAALCMSSRYLRTAAAAVCMSLDLKDASDEELDAVKDVRSLKVQRMELGSLEFGESVLRSRNFQLRCGATLLWLSAFVTTTDTLQHYPSLKALELHSGDGFRRLYPAVLSGLSDLRHLRLINYIYEAGVILAGGNTSPIPLEVWRTLRSLYIQPHPGHLLNHVNLALPSMEMIRARNPKIVRGSYRDCCSLFQMTRLEVNACFESLQHAKAAPRLDVNIRTLNASRHIKLQGDCICVFPYLMSEGLALTEQGTALVPTASLNPLKTFLRLLEDMSFWETIAFEYSTEFVIDCGRLGIWWSDKVHQDSLLLELGNQYGHPDASPIRWELRSERRGVLDITVLYLSRACASES